MADATSSGGAGRRVLLGSVSWWARVRGRDRSAEVDAAAARIAAERRWAAAVRDERARSADVLRILTERLLAAQAEVDRLRRELSEARDVASTEPSPEPSPELAEVHAWPRRHRIEADPAAVGDATPAVLDLPIRRLPAMPNYEVAEQA